MAQYDVLNDENKGGGFHQVVVIADDDGNIINPSEFGGSGSANALTATGVTLAIKAGDGPSIDAFSRWRVSSPNYIFDTNFQYTLQPLIFEAVTAQGGTVTHDVTNRNALMTFSSTPAGGNAYMQTYEWFRYQAGRSQEILLTFNFVETAANTTKFVGYSDGNNGIELQLTATGAQIALLSDTDKGDETVAQASWNIDPMDGTGPSGVTLDFTKTQIFFIDFQWLGVGRVRCGFDVDGILYYVHQFLHANYQTVAYMQTANLPLRAGMSCTDTSSTTMKFICASVATEGGEKDVGGFPHSANSFVTAGNSARTHLLSIRPKTEFHGIENRAKIILTNLEITVTGSNPVLWELTIGQGITGASWANVSTAHSTVERTTVGTISGEPNLIIKSGIVAASNQSKGSTSRAMTNKIPLTLDAAGVQRGNGTLTISVTGLGGTSDVYGALDWDELH